MTPETITRLFEACICPVCGFQLGFKPWDGESASDEICPSCGIQFGYDDAAGGELAGKFQVYSAWRRRWIDSGMKWWSKRDQPSDWNPKAQIERLQTVA
jgi:hypothetical protein